MNPPLLQRRPPAKRLHHGIAGSPLATIIPFPAPETQTPAPPKKRGRPRKHTDDATKQKAYRERKDSGAVEIDREAKAAAKKPRVSTKNKLIIPVSESWFVEGRGKYLTGGYGEKQLQEAEAEKERALHGGRVTQPGAGPSLFEDAWKTEYEDTFTRRITFPKHDKLDEGAKEKILEEIIRENITVALCQGYHEELKNVCDRYYMIYCDLCKERLGASVTCFMDEGFVLDHFYDEHDRLIRKAWKDATPKPAPKAAPKPAPDPVTGKRPVKKCLEDHEQFAKFLATLGDLGVSGVHCEKCRRLIYSAADPRSPYYRNTQSEIRKPNEVNELTQTIDIDAIKGKGNNSSHASHPGIEETPKTTESSEEDRPNDSDIE